MRIRLGPLACHLSRLARRRGAEYTGFLLGAAGGGLVEAYAYVPVRNIASRPDRFTGDPWDTIVAHTIAENMGLEVVAVFHTHPCGIPEPSVLDLDGMRKWPMPWVIAGAGGAIRAWVLPGPEEVPVEGSPCRGPH